MPRLKEADRSERRQRLIEAAWRCATRKGYRDITVDDVCAEAEASKGAFYLYFASKQELLLGLLEDDAKQVEQQMRVLEELDVSAGERVRRFTRWMLERAAEPGRAQVRADLWTLAFTEPAVERRFSEVIDRQRAQLRSWIEAGVASAEIVDIPANALASLLLALQDGLLLHAAIDGSAFRWERIRRSLNGLLTGLQPR